MIGIEKPRIEFSDSMEETAHGVFVVEPLERGFGTTLGNSLRRVLLSSLPGYAITSVKIESIAITPISGAKSCLFLSEET